MNVTIRLIGRYKDLVGQDTLIVPLQDEETIWQILNILGKQYPQIDKDKKFIIVAKNNIYTNKEQPVADGDEITITPPVVSGG